MKFLGFSNFPRFRNFQKFRNCGCPYFSELSDVSQVSNFRIFGRSVCFFFHFRVVGVSGRFSSLLPVFQVCHLPVFWFSGGAFDSCFPRFTLFSCSDRVFGFSKFSNFPVFRAQKTSKIKKNHEFTNRNCLMFFLFGARYKTQTQKFAFVLFFRAPNKSTILLFGCQPPSRPRHTKQHHSTTVLLNCCTLVFYYITILLYYYITIVL